ncbi:FKBP-type peptidyl-prolyl cis-trans isomerase [Gracilaria domingensis]|nr:FKBP-type peptidyl-prolyl cis-trans isomerase [Gracilaria domingensis]
MGQHTTAFGVSFPLGVQSCSSRNLRPNRLTSFRMGLEPGADAKVSRRTFVAFIASLPLTYKSKSVKGAPEYDAIRTRRYVDLGRPPADRKPPTFIDNVPIYPIDELKIQDIVVGNGGTVKNGSLVVARWVTILDNGSTLDDTNENNPAMFRPGAHQVPPGVEDAVVGMRVGGMRRVYGTSERILT